MGPGATRAPVPAAPVAAPTAPAAAPAALAPALAVPAPPALGACSTLPLASPLPP